MALCTVIDDSTITHEVAQEREIKALSGIRGLCYHGLGTGQTYTLVRHATSPFPVMLTGVIATHNGRIDIPITRHRQHAHTAAQSAARHASASSDRGPLTSACARPAAPRRSRYLALPALAARVLLRRAPAVADRPRRLLLPRRRSRCLHVRRGEEALPRGRRLAATTRTPSWCGGIIDHHGARSHGSRLARPCLPARRRARVRRGL